jgi:transposase
MKMYRDLPEIDEPLEELESKLRAERNAQVRRRIHLLVLIRSGKIRTRLAAAEHLAVHRNTIRNWLDLYDAGGVERMVRIAPGGARSEQRTLPKPVLAALETRLDSEGFGGYAEANRWLEQEFDISARYSTVHGIIRRRLGAKLKRARPAHVKKTMSRPRASRAC